MRSGPQTDSTAFEVLHSLGSEGRVETSLARVPGHDVPRLVRVISGEGTERFLEACRVLASLPPAGLLPVLGSGRLDERRVYVVTEEPRVESLDRLSSMPAESGPLFAPVAEALARIHAAGLCLGGAVSAQQLFVGAEARLDASLAGLARPAATPADDVRALITTLSRCGVALEGLAADASPDAPVGALTDAHLLAEFLADAQGSWRSQTAVSGKYPQLVVEAAEPDLTGGTLGPWHLERVLGEGAMGKVYLGRHARIGRVAAVKVLKTEHAKHADSLQRFIQEATAVNAIKNEHIVEVMDFGEQPGPTGETVVFCVMELLEGRSLTSAMWAEPFTVARAAKVARALALALDAAHQVGVVHRDVKPDNVFLQAREADHEFVKVLDFGVAKLLKPLGDLPVAGTQAGMVIGTPDYMAPEQALGAPSDFRVDLWAVGVVLSELLTGHRPYAGDTFQQLLIELATKEPAPLALRTRGGEDIPQEIRDIVSWCLMRKPEERPASGADLALALEPFAGPPLPLATVTPLPMGAPTPAPSRPPSGLTGRQRTPTPAPLPPGFEPLPSRGTPLPTQAPLLSLAQVPEVAAVRQAGSRVRLYAGLAVGLVVAGLVLGLALGRSTHPAPPRPVEPALSGGAPSLPSPLVPLASERSGERVPTVVAPPAPVALASARPDEPAPPAPPAASPVAPTRPAEPPLAVSWLDVTSTPPGAMVRDRSTTLVLGTTPMRAALVPRKTLPLSIELDGHRPLLRDVAFTTDAQLKVTLEALPRKKALAPLKKAAPKKGGPARDRIVDPFKR